MARFHPDPRPRLGQRAVSPIDEYIRRLDTELRLARAPRRRLLEEVEGHLRASAAERDDEGRGREDAETLAVASFGSAAMLARRFAHAAASSAIRRALLWTGLAFSSYALAVVVFMFSALVWLRDFPQGAPSALLVQVAAVALVLSTIRVLRPRGGDVIEARRLRLGANGLLICALAIGGAVVAELLLALTRPAQAPWSDEWVVIAAYALAAFVSFPSSLIAVAGFSRASAIRDLPGDGSVEPDSTLAHDVGALVPALARPVSLALRHPARTCALVAAVAFTTVTAVQLIGTDFAHHASIMSGAIATGLLEASAILAAYLMLGRPLGLRAP